MQLPRSLRWENPALFDLLKKISLYKRSHWRVGKQNLNHSRTFHQGEKQQHSNWNHFIYIIRTADYSEALKKSVFTKKYWTHLIIFPFPLHSRAKTSCWCQSVIFNSPVFHYCRLAELKVNDPKVVRDQTFLSMAIPLHFPSVCICIKYVREDLCRDFENLLGSDRMESVFGRNWSQRIPWYPSRHLSPKNKESVTRRCCNSLSEHCFSFSGCDQKERKTMLFFQTGNKALLSQSLVTEELHTPILCCLSCADGNQNIQESNPQTPSTGASRQRCLKTLILRTHATVSG